jgi:hypothetical protein
MNTTNCPQKAQQVLEEVLERLECSGNPLETHLPQRIYDLDKPALLAVIHQLMAHIDHKA